MPKVSMDGTYTRSGSHRFTSSRWASGSNYHGDLWKSGFDATWEIDVFGGMRRAYESAARTKSLTPISMLMEVWRSMYMALSL